MSTNALASRRAFLAGGLATGIAATTSSIAPAADPPGRNGKSHMKLSLAGYSFSRLLPTRPTPAQEKSAKMTMDGFIKFCADQDVDGVEPTTYYFPKTVTDEYLVHMKELTFRLGLDISGTAIGNDFCVAEGKGREKQLSDARQWIDHAAVLGAPVIRIFAGRVPKGDTEAAAIAAVFHIINHLTFKAALFMTAGIIDHETHTRDIKRLGGLRRLMPVTFVIGTVAALSMAGIPLFNGFLSKEMMLEEASHTEWWQNPWIVPALATLGALLSVAYSLRFIAHVFFGPVRDDYPSKPHDPPAGMWASPAFLAVLVILIGVMPVLVEPLVIVAADAVTGGLDYAPHLKIWHGVTPALWMSGIAVLGGIILLALHAPLDRLWLATPRPEAKSIFDRLVGGTVALSRAISERSHNGAISRYLAIFVVTTVISGYLAWRGGGMPVQTRGMIPIPPVVWVGWMLLLVATISVVIGLSRWYGSGLAAMVAPSTSSSGAWGHHATGHVRPSRWTKAPAKRCGQHS